MRKGIAFIAVAVLVALAFFLPERLSTLRDQQLLDNPSIQVQGEAQESFAESLQLSLAEKVMLLRSGTLTVMELDHNEIAGFSAVIVAGVEETEVEFSANMAIPPEDMPELKAASQEDISAYVEEVSQLWRSRLEEIQLELRSLQAAGGMPELWGEDNELFYTGYGDLLYMDPDTKMSFQVYRILLGGEFYTLESQVDVQSGRILSFQLRWTKGGHPNWGLRGAANFGGVWRNYWGLDSVSSAWYGEYNRSILESTEETTRTDGNYSAHGQIAFTYDGQSLPIPLECEAYIGRSFSISWNI